MITEYESKKTSVDKRPNSKTERTKDSDLRSIAYQLHVAMMQIQRLNVRARPPTHHRVSDITGAPGPVPRGDVPESLLPAPSLRDAREIQAVLKQ